MIRDWRGSHLRCLMVIENRWCVVKTPNGRPWVMDKPYYDDLPEITEEPTGA